MAHLASLAEALLAVARAGSLTAAARTLGVSQPTLTRHLDELERRVGQLLLERSASGTKLTASGEALLPMAEHVATGVDRFARVIDDADRVSDGVRVGLAEPAVPELVTPLLEKHRAAFPTRGIQVLSVARHEAPAALQVGDVDVVVGSRCLGHRFAVRSVTAEEYVVVAGPSFAARHRRSRPTLSDVARERIVLPTWIDDDEVAEWTAGDRHTSLPVAERLDDFNQIWFAIVFGGSISIVPRAFARCHTPPRTAMLPMSIEARSTLEVCRLRRSTRSARQFMSTVGELSGRGGT